MTEVRTEENAIILASATRLVSVGREAAALILDGKDVDEQYTTGFNIITLLEAYKMRSELSDVEIDGLLYCLRQTSDADFFPTTNPIVGKDTVSIINVQGMGIQFFDEGVQLGNISVNEVDYVGPGITATRNGNRLTVTVNTGSGITLVENYNALSGLYPTTYNGGAISRGDQFDISAASPADVNGDRKFPLGATLRAKVANPGQTDANWRIYY
jgi:hypothetical protein